MRPRGPRFHHAEKKTTSARGQQIIEVGHVDRWKPEWRQPLWHLAQQFHAQAAEIHHRSNDNAGDDNEQGHRFVLRNRLPSSNSASAPRPSKSDAVFVSRRCEKK
jgi:hypothetical protein